MPKVTSVWLSMFRKSNGISWRLPNRRYKVSRSKIKAGLSVTWRNIWRARLLFRLLFGKQREAKGLAVDPVTNHVDQKGIHFNEGDSKLLKTLDYSGTTDVPIKTNHSDSRSRLTANTMVTYPNPPMPPGAAYQPPIEVLFKLKTDKCLRELRVPHGVVMTLSFSESGSYNAKPFLEYLRRHLEVLTPQRIADADYRILALDAFEVHKMDEVKELAMSRGYILIFHRGGTTGIGQWNDTGLHLLVEQQFVELERMDFNKQLAIRPWRCPTRSRQAILDDLGSLWATLPHASIGKKEALMTGWAIALPRQKPDGTFEAHASEDQLVAREARTFFLESRMPEVRAKDLEVVYRAWAAGKITCWNDVAEHMLPFDNDDIEREGMELLDGDDEGKPWKDDDDDDDSDDEGHGPGCPPIKDDRAPPHSDAGSAAAAPSPAAAAAVAREDCAGVQASTRWRVAPVAFITPACVQVMQQGGRF